MPSPSTLLARVNRVPPCLCRLLARKANGRQGMTHAEIAKLSGLSLSMVSWLSHRKNWNGVAVDTVQAFSHACGVNLLATARHIEFLKWRNMSYVQRGSKNQRRMYMRLLDLMQKK